MPGACSRDGTDHSVLVDSLGPDLAVAGSIRRGALYGRNVTGFWRALLLPGISPAKLVSKTSADSFLWVTLALASWTWFWLKITQGRERKGRPDSTRSYSRVAFFTTAFLTVFDGIGLDTAAALLPIFLILLPLELIWRRFSCTYEPIRS